MSLFDDDGPVLFDLFEDASSDFPTESSTGAKSSSSSGLTQPPSMRDASGLAGLANQGATCYMNALIQTLFHTPQFREQLYSLSKWVLLCFPV